MRLLHRARYDALFATPLRNVLFVTRSLQPALRDALFTTRCLERGLRDALILTHASRRRDALFGTSSSLRTFHSTLFATLICGALFVTLS